MWGFFLTWVLTSDYSGKHVSAWAIIAPAPEFIFHFHSEAVTRLWREQWGGRQRQAACSSNSLSAPIYLQELWDAPKHQVQREGGSATLFSQASLSGMETRFGLSGEWSLLYENWWPRVEGSVRISEGARASDLPSQSPWEQSAPFFSVYKRRKACSLLLMTHRFGKYWFTWNPWGSSEINVIFINTSCIRTCCHRNQNGKNSRSMSRRWNLWPELVFALHCL